MGTRRWGFPAILVLSFLLTPTGYRVAHFGKMTKLCLKTKQNKNYTVWLLSGVGTAPPSFPSDPFLNL